MKLYRKNDNSEVRLPEKSKVSLDIRVLDRHGRESTLSLPSFVEKVNHDRSFLILMPIYQNGFYPLRYDEVCLMYFKAELEKSGIHGIFAVPVCFTDKIEQGDRVYARMEPLGNIEQSQRRDCYRLPISIFVSLQRTGDNNTLPTSARLIDFSDGGMLLTTYENLKVGETIILDFNIDRQETVEAVVLRTEPAEQGRRGFRIAVKFANAGRKQKQRFYRFIMEKQLEKRQRHKCAQ